MIFDNETKKYISSKEINKETMEMLEDLDNDDNSQKNDLEDDKDDKDIICQEYSYDYVKSVLFHPDLNTNDWKKIGYMDGNTIFPDRYLYSIINSDLSGNEIKVLLYLIRMIKGFKIRNKKPISTKDIVIGTGIRSKNIYIPINKLIKKNIIWKDKNNNFQLNTDVISWNNNNQKGIDYMVILKSTKKSIKNLLEKFKMG